MHTPPGMRSPNWFRGGDYPNWFIVLMLVSFFVILGFFYYSSYKRMHVDDKNNRKTVSEN